jgi:hypothetical protein
MANPATDKNTKKPRRNPGVPVPSEDWDVFFEVLSETANVTKACEAANVNRLTAYDRKRFDKEFHEKWEYAYARGYDKLEESAQRRAFEGCTKPVFYKGDICGYILEYSDALTTFLLKGRKPEIFRDRTEVTMNGGDGRTKKELTDDELDALIAQRAGNAQ